MLIGESHVPFARGRRSDSVRQVETGFTYFLGGLASVNCSKSFHSPVKLDLDSILDLEVGIPCRPDALHTACVFLVAYLEDQFPPAEHDSQRCIGVLATDALN